MLTVMSAVRPGAAVVRASAADKAGKQTSKSAPAVAGQSTRAKKAAILSGLAAVPASLPSGALALDREQAESIAKTIEDGQQGILSLFGKVTDAANVAAEAVSPVTKEYVAPFASEATKQASRAVEEINKAATPVVKKSLETVSKEIEKDSVSALKAAQTTVDSAIKSTGVDVDPLIGVSKKAGTIAKDAATTAQPTVVKAFNDAVSYVQHLDHAVITAAAAVGIFAAATAPLWGPSAVKALRGYAGDINAVKAYDEVNKGEAFLIDLRSAKAQEKGIPSLSRGRSRLFLIEPETVSDGAIRSRVKDVEGLEIKSTAVVIAALKKLSKTSKVILMGPKAVPVATALSAKGFSNVFVMSGGFDKKRGWVDSGLAVEAGPQPAKEIETIEGKLLPF